MTKGFSVINNLSVTTGIATNYSRSDILDKFKFFYQIYVTMAPTNKTVNTNKKLKKY